MAERCEHTHVRLISKEGHVFVVDTAAASVSKLIASMMASANFTEAQQGEVRLPDITTAVLEKVCQYFYHDLRCKQIRAARGPETPLPEFPIAPEIVLELLQASNYLDC